MEEIVIKITWIYFLGILGSLLAIAWYVSGRFSRIETLTEGVDRRLTNLEGRYYGAIQTQSPISLTVKGDKLLEDSGLKEYINKNSETFFSDCEKAKKLESAYDVQSASFACLDVHEFEPQFEKKLKEFAFQQGADLKLLRRVGGIYLRDLLLKKLNMDVNELDQTQV